jgi:hypothetical protein
LLIHFRLVKEGYGTLLEVIEFDARTVLQALAYEGFCGDYEQTYLELNK